MSTTKNVYQRISAVMAALPYIQKKKLVPLGGRQVKTLAYEDLAAEVQPLLVANGLVMESDLVKCSYEVQETGEKTDNYGTKKTYQTIASVEIRYRLVNVDNPDDATSWMIYPGMGYDTSDKAIGKATTYSAKDYLRKMLLVPSGEEPEDDDHQRAGKAHAGPQDEFPPRSGPIGKPAAKPAPADPAKAANVTRADLEALDLKGLAERCYRAHGLDPIKEEVARLGGDMGVKAEKNFGLGTDGVKALREALIVRMTEGGN